MPVEVQVGRLISKALCYIVLVFGGILMVLPFWWMFVTSFKLPEEVFTFPPDFFPSVWHWGNYLEVVKAVPFGRFFLNTFIVSSVVTVGNLLLCSMAGYAFARLKFSGWELIFWLFLASMMIPGQVTMIPVFVLMAKLGWIDTYLGLTVPGLVGAYGIFLMRQYFLSLPIDLENAARCEGATEWQIFCHIMFPLARPALAVLGVFTFMGAWTDFLWPLLMTNSMNMRTLEVGLSVFRSQYTVNWPLQMAGSMIIQTPIIILFLLTQKYFTRGIALTGIKG